MATFSFGGGHCGTRAWMGFRVSVRWLVLAGNVNKIGGRKSWKKAFSKARSKIARKQLFRLICLNVPFVCLPLTPFFPTERKGSHSTIVHVFFVCFYYDDQLLRVACLTGVDGPGVNDFSGHPNCKKSNQNFTRNQGNSISFLPDVRPKEIQQGQRRRRPRVDGHNYRSRHRRQLEKKIQQRFNLHLHRQRFAVCQSFSQHQWYVRRVHHSKIHGSKTVRIGSPRLRIGRRHVPCHDVDARQSVCLDQW